jgi:hypothetical protein
VEVLELHHQRLVETLAQDDTFDRLLCLLKTWSTRYPGIAGVRRNITEAAINHLWGRDLLIVGDVGLEHSNGARDKQHDDTQRNENLHHSE